jgi:hypothetical protein
MYSHSASIFSGFSTDLLCWRDRAADIAIDPGTVSVLEPIAWVIPVKKAVLIATVHHNLTLGLN